MSYYRDGLPGYDAWKTRSPEDDEYMRGEDPDEEADDPANEEELYLEDQEEPYEEDEQD